MLAAIGTVAIAGCLSETSSDDPEPTNDSGETTDLLSSELPDSRVYSIDERAEYDSVLIKAWSLESRDTVEYKDTDAAEIKTWDPGNDRSIVVADLRVENLSDDRLEYPRWDQFELVTPGGSVAPVLETPDGVSVEKIRDPHVSWTDSSGLRADYTRGWTAVYNAPAYEVSNYAVKWTYPDDPIFWRSI